MAHQTRLTLTIFALGYALGATGCASVGGQAVHTVHCDGPGKGWDQCAAAAATTCGTKGYDLIRRSDQDVPAQPRGAIADGFGAPAVDTDQRSMVISCHGP